MNFDNQIIDLFENEPILVNPIVSTVDNRSIGEPFDFSLQELKEYTYQGIKLGAKYFNVEPRYPNKIGWNYEIMFTDPMIAGYQIEGYDKSDYLNEIGYNPLLALSPKKVKMKVAFHEGFHEVQRGKRILSDIIYDSNDREFKYERLRKNPSDKYPFSEMIMEGDVEIGVEKEVDMETSYPVSYRLAEIINHYLQNQNLNLNEIYNLADITEKKLEEKLKDPYFNPNELKPNDVPLELTKILFVLNKTPEIKKIAHWYVLNKKSDLSYIV